MLKIVITILCFSLIIQAEDTYRGFLDQKPVTMVLLDAGQTVRGSFIYEDENTPIVLAGYRRSDTIVLSLYDDQTAFLTLYQSSSDSLCGIHINSQKSISLSKDIVSTPNYELRAATSNTIHYFTYYVKAKPSPKVTGINIYEKTNDSLLQNIPVEDFISVDYIGDLATGDFNFDGYSDFSFLTTQGKSFYVFDVENGLYIERSFPNDIYWNHEKKLVYLPIKNSSPIIKRKVHIFDNDTLKYLKDECLEMKFTDSGREFVTIPCQ